MKTTIKITALLSTLIFMIGVESKLLSQNNLVLNYSFEDTLSCPVTFGQICLSTHWFQPYILNNTLCNSSSTDYFNSCNTTNSYSVPNNLVGYQHAKTGNAYAGILAYYHPIVPNYREYLQGTLSERLIANKKYCVSFYVSLAEHSKYCTDRIGIYFTNDTLYTINYYYGCINITPQVESPELVFLNDMQNWIEIHGDFIAQGGEKFFTIGSFRDSNEVNTQTLSNLYPFYAYYYIDDVSVWYCDKPEDAATTPLKLPNAFSPNGDGFNDFFVIEGIEQYPNNELYIYNRWGELVYYAAPYQNNWTGHRNTPLNPLSRGEVQCTKPLVEGTYFYVFRTGKENESYTGFLELRI